MAEAKRWVASLERVERERTGIKTLKVGYNKVFGYYLEITHANTRAPCPADYIRKQTLVNAERYITPELKEREALILNAAERTQELETQLFRELLAEHRRATPSELLADGPGPRASGCLPGSGRGRRGEPAMCAPS